MVVGKDGTWLPVRTSCNRVVRTAVFSGITLMIPKTFSDKTECEGAAEGEE